MIPKYGEEEQQNQITQFEKPLFLFPLEHVVYLCDINKVLPSHVPTKGIR